MYLRDKWIYAMKLDMVLVPEGPFVMGATRDAEPDCELDEMPQRTVWLSAYMIQRTPISIRQWAEFVEDTRYDWAPSQPVAGLPTPPDYPVTNVSWYDCGEFANWLSKRLNDSYSLPTEAQWEKACRGSSAQVYPWGDYELDTTAEVVRATEQN